MGVSTVLGLSAQTLSSDTIETVGANCTCRTLSPIVIRGEGVIRATGLLICRLGLCAAPVVKYQCVNRPSSVNAFQPTKRGPLASAVLSEETNVRRSRLNLKASSSLSGRESRKNWRKTYGAKTSHILTSYLSNPIMNYVSSVCNALILQ